MELPCPGCVLLPGCETARQMYVWLMTCRQGGLPVVALNLTCFRVPSAPPEARVGPSKAVTKIRTPNHRRRGRPRAAVPRQLSLADQEGLSLRKRAALMGVSRMTVWRWDRQSRTAARV